MTLPTFIIIGAAKSGTTSIYDYMKQHPDICMSRIKETNFFAHGDQYVHDNWSHLPFPVTDLAAYKEQYSEMTVESHIGEASPIYLESPVAPEQIHSILPAVKLIASLRNPVTRAYSGYLMHVREGGAKGDLSDFSDEKRYVQGGFYSSRLKRYYDLFDKDQIKVCLFEDLKENPQKVVRELYQFIGADSAFLPDTERRLNVGSFPKRMWLNSILVHPVVRDRIAGMVPKGVRKMGKKVLASNRTRPPEMPPELKVHLQNIYSDEILRLEDMLELDLTRWKNS